ncbi:MULTISPECIES: chorismate--pyruvate lyase family protein [Methylomonas]|uniref:chorismate--pyruvate lyase family protein n=1 Tax=Methylomonas TaxID=416 RepID=UPI0012325FE7|nr:chorismate lyase [Methylomonas rhizoryzae]
MHNSYLFLRSPRWSAGIGNAGSRAPAILQPWLQEQGSLTKRLRRYFGANVAVSLLFHQWQPAFVEECRQLAVPHSRYQLIREVLLHADGVPLVLARTVLPAATIKIAQRNLSHLGTRPLGEVIFSYPDLALTQRDFSLATAAQWSTAVRLRFLGEQAVFGRRTLYGIHRQPLLVAEFFLPEMLHQLSEQGEN